MRSIPFAMAVLAFNQSVVEVTLGEVGPPPDGVWPDHECDKTLVCNGTPEPGGICAAYGYYCHNITCESRPGCDYWYDWACVEKEDSRCAHLSQAELHAPDCGPACLNVGWGACECRCLELGSGTSEGGVYWQCFTQGGDT